MNIIRSGWRLLALLVPLLVLSAGCGNDDSLPPDDEEPVVPVKLALDWSTFWGGSGGDGATRGNSLAVTPAGEVIVVGETQSRSFFVKNPVITLTKQASKGFITRFAAGGREIVYSTKIGSTGMYDWCTGVAVDVSDNAVVVGRAGGADFPLKNPLYSNFTNEWQCGFLCSIPPHGGSLNFSTFIPQGVPAAVAVGADGAIYLATHNNHVLKVAADGSRLLYDFLVSANESGMDIYAIAVDGDGRVWLTGGSDYSFKPLLNPLQQAEGIHNGEVLVARVNAAGSALDFSTLLGGAKSEYGKQIAVGGDGMVYVLGSTNSDDFPVKNAVDSSWNGDWDCFLVKINAANPSIVYATYAGGDWEDRGDGLAVTAAGEAWIAGMTTSHDLPVTGSYQEKLAGVKDAFIARLSADGSRWRVMSYFGGSQTANHSEVGADWCNALGLGTDGKIFLTGETYSSDFPLQNAIDPVYSLPKAFVSVFREE